VKATGKTIVVRAQITAINTDLRNGRRAANGSSQTMY
jgi:hypothetical protein